MYIVNMFSAKILLFLITSTFFLQYTSQEKQIRGLPEVDYPTYYVIPKTSFRCSDQLYNPGFYADTETRCQVFHYCYEHRQESFLCPLGTIFNQPILACDYWYSSNCSLAPTYYHVNVNERNVDHFEEAEDPPDSHSGNLFDKMAHLYEINNKAPESPVLKKDSDAPENKFLGRDGVESSVESFIEKNNETEDYNKYSYDNQFSMVDEEHPEVVKYEVRGLNTLNILKGSENEQLSETDNEKDLIFSEDGMLHTSQDNVYQMYPTDMNFNQEYSGYAEIPSEGNVKYDINGNFYPESDFQVSDSVLQKRYVAMNSNVRRPSRRKPVIVTPEAEPEIVQLSVVKHKRKPIGVTSTVPTNADTESSYKTNYDSSIYKDTILIANEGGESTTSVEFPLYEPNSDLNDYQLMDPELFYESNDENGSQMHQTDSSNAIYDYSNKKETRNAHVLSNKDEDYASSVFESESNDFNSISNAEHRSTLIDSNNGDESEIFMENPEGSTVLPGKSSQTAFEGKSSFDSDPFLGLGSEENAKNFHSSDGSSFLDDQYVYSESEDTEIADTETHYVEPTSLSDTFEGSGISVPDTSDVPNFTEKVNEPIHFVLKDYSEGGIEYGKESSFSSETFENFVPMENLEDNGGVELVPDGIDGSNGFNYLPHELQESPDIPQDASDETVPEIREIDGSYYVFSDPEYNSNYEYDGSSRFHSEDVDYAVTEDSEDIFDKTTKKFINIEGSEYSSTDSKFKMDNIEDGALSTLGHQDSRPLENVYEFEAETSSDIPEYAIDDYDSNRELSTEDLKFLEILSQNPSPMLKNLFDVSNEKAQSDDKHEEMPRIEIIAPEQESNQQEASHEDTGSKEDVYEFENLASDTSSNFGEHLIAASSENNSKILNPEQISEEVSNIDGSGQDASEIFSPEQKLETFVLRKEADPFNPLFAENDKILLDSAGSKQKLSLKVPPVQIKNVVVSPFMEKDSKKVSRGKRFNENLRTFNPPNKGNPLKIPREETFREAMFTNIPSAFLKMKHSTLRPYFYDYGLKNSGFNPRAGDLFESSKLSKLTSLGKRLLAAKSAKFNRMKKYIDSYRN